MDQSQFAEPKDANEAELRLGQLKADIIVINMQLTQSCEDWSAVKGFAPGEAVAADMYKDWKSRATFARALKQAEVVYLEAYLRVENKKQAAALQAQAAAARTEKEARLARMQAVLESDSANDCVLLLWQAARQAVRGNSDALTWEVIDPVNDWLRSRGYLEG